MSQISLKPSLPSSDSPPALTPQSDDPPSPQRALAAERQIIDRLTFGFTTYELWLLRALGAEGYISYHLNPGAIDDSGLAAYLAANYPSLVMTPQNLSTQQAGD